MAIRTRDPEAKRKAVLAEAGPVFTKRGFKAASTEVIAEAAGVSEGLIFHYFGSKIGLLEAYVTSEAGVAVASAMNGPPLDFDVLLSEVFRWVGADPLSARLSAAGDDRVMGALRRGWQHAVVPPLADALAVEQAAGRCRPGEPLVIARLQFAVVGEAMLMFFAGDSSWGDDVDAAVVETAHVLRSMITPGD